jgi:hypothetical protein
MTQQDYTDHPITPPPELVEQWRDLPEFTDGRRKMIMVTLSREKLLDIATHAARWGADQELEACCHLLRQQGFDVVDDLRATRRPKPPSLKERALKILEEEPESDDMKELIVFDTAQVEIIRLALEQLDD